MRYGLSRLIWLKMSPHRGLPGHGSKPGLGVGAALAEGAAVALALGPVVLGASAELATGDVDGGLAEGRPMSRTLSPQPETTTASAINRANGRMVTAYLRSNEHPASTVRSLRGLIAKLDLLDLDAHLARHAAELEAP